MANIFGNTLNIFHRQQIFFDRRFTKTETIFGKIFIRSTHVWRVSTPLCLKSISELMLASSRLSLWTLALAWCTSDFRRSGSYFVLEVELVEFTETKK